MASASRRRWRIRSIVPLRGCSPAGRFFLERVQDVQDALEAYRVDGSIGIAVKVVANLQNSAQTLQRLGVVWVLPDLRFKKGLPNSAADGRGKSVQVLSARAYENRRFDSAEQIFHDRYRYIPIYVCQELLTGREAKAT